MTNEKRKELSDRYLAAGHAMQSGVAILIERAAAPDVTPKHLRVGVNSALVDSSALGALLIRKGLITDEEYFTAMAEGMEAEARKYELEVQELLGAKVRLG